MTAQSRDSIIYKGNEYGLASEPFEQYQTTRNHIRFDGICSANWKGYNAKWEIIDDKLYLIDLVGYRLDEKFITFNDIFPDKDKVFAEWFSGKIKMTGGEMLKYIHGGYASVFETDIFLFLVDGIVISEETVDNRNKEFDNFGFLVKEKRIKKMINYISNLFKKVINK